MPGLASCPSGLIVIGILTFSCVHVNSEILSNEVSDVQFAAVGSTVTLTCRGSHPGSPVVWTHNGSLVRTRQTHPSDGSLTLTNTTHSTEGNYSCHGPRGVLLHSVTLRLGYAPEYVSVSCKLPSHFKVLCTWTQRTRTRLPTKYIASYSVDNSSPEPCEQELMDVNECTVIDPEFWSSKHLINVTEINPLGSKSTIAYVDVNKNLKPDAPEELICEHVNAAPTQLFVRWKPPASWPSDTAGAFPLKFELQYKPVGSKLWSKLETEDTSMVIMDALMGHLHHIRVRAQDAFINHSQWSEWSQVVQAQPWSDLSTIPKTTTDDVYAPIVPSTFPVKATEKSPDSSFEENESQVLIILSLLAAAMVVVVFAITVLLCVRNRRRGNMSKQELTSMVKMKSLLI